ncbi:uncharacterized protein J3R85_021097 [Psidium guajava]|nr:uncharacterized protein J3R85_021097 [Psidium guajava]
MSESLNGDLRRRSVASDAIRTTSFAAAGGSLQELLHRRRVHLEEQVVAGEEVAEVRLALLQPAQHLGARDPHRPHQPCPPPQEPPQPRDPELEPPLDSDPLEPRVPQLGPHDRPVSLEDVAVEDETAGIAAADAGAFCFQSLVWEFGGGGHEKGRER